MRKIIKKSNSSNAHELSNVAWGIAEVLRHDFKPAEYQNVVLPFVFLARVSGLTSGGKENLKLAIASAIDAPTPTKALKNLNDFLASVPSPIAEIFLDFEFDVTIKKLFATKLLKHVLAQTDHLVQLASEASNEQIGELYEELLRRFAETVGETAGEHYTPREVVQLMTKLLASPNFLENFKSKKIAVFDPACGAGGMIENARKEIKKSSGMKIEIFGQELNSQTCALANLIHFSSSSVGRISKGNSITDDAFAGDQFDLMIANPPFGVDWKKMAEFVKDEHLTLGFEGRFGAGLPRVSDGSLLFLQHMISKFRAKSESRIAIVLSGSALFSGIAGSGESQIREWILRNDWLEGVIALPDCLFYNTAISTYILVLTNKKEESLRGYVKVVDAREHFKKLARSQGSRRKEISQDQIDEILKIYFNFKHDNIAKLVDRESFVRFRIPLNVEFKDSEISKEIISMPWPIGFDLLEPHEYLGNPHVEDVVRKFVSTNVEPHVVNCKIDMSGIKTICQISFGQLFHRQSDSTDLGGATARLAAQLNELQSLVAKIEL